jgi:hypothetical protein
MLTIHPRGEDLALFVEVVFVAFFPGLEIFVRVLLRCLECRECADI